MSEYDSIATPEHVLKLAGQRTGLTEIDSDSWRDGLSIILDDINNSPAFTPFGRERVLDDATNALGRRLQIHAYIQAHPEVLDAPVQRPLIVLGMPRTGTTVISYLLDQDPARRSLIHWQCVHPVPPATTETLRTDPRVTVMDRVNVRALEPVTPAPDLVVADLSFISLTLVLPALVAAATPEADFVLLVKPQFEVGKGRVGAGGVVRDTTHRFSRWACGAIIANREPPRASPGPS